MPHSRLVKGGGSEGGDRVETKRQLVECYHYVNTERNTGRVKLNEQNKENHLARHRQGETFSTGCQRRYISEGREIVNMFNVCGGATKGEKYKHRNSRELKSTKHTSRREVKKYNK